MTTKASNSSVDSTEQPLFVLGVYRSGTTLLWNLLNQHSQIAIWFEADVLRLASVATIDGHLRNDWKSRIDFWDGAIRRWQRQVQQVPEQADTPGELARQLYRQLAREKGKQVCGEKSPQYFHMLDRLAEEFPQGRFLFIFRDAHGVARSILKGAEASPFFRDPKRLHIALLGNDELHQAYIRFQQQGLKVAHVHFEELITLPEATLKPALERLGLTFEPAMARIGETDLKILEYPGIHRNLFTGSFVRPTSQGQVIPEAMDRKIGRYKRRWDALYRGHKGIDHPHVDVTPGDLVDDKELARDRARYRRHFRRTAFIMYLYARLPLGLLRLYRRLKGMLK